jgi:DNA polymerase
MPAAAPWFAKRFANMHWTILTPDASATWDTQNLTFGPGAARSPVSEDDLEDLWRTYYASIFNPARVKVKAMKKEMAVRHWPTLPETELIPRLLRSARTRVHSMVESSAPAPGIGVSALEFMPRTTELPVLRDAIHQCHGCELYCHATQPVFGRGPENAALMFVGEQPGDQEDLAGLPFVGPAGQLFDEALAAVGIDRSSCYVTNSVKHFRFEVRGKRRIHSKPSARHVAACKPWLQAEISIVKPRMIVALGSTAATAILGPTIRILRDRGQVFRDNPSAPWIMPTIHPSALLRMPDPDQRALAHEQFLADLRITADELFRQSP